MDLLEASRNESGTPLHHAISENRESSVRLLLDAGADVNEHGPYNFTPLHAAVISYSSMPILRLLLERGADVKARDDYRRTPGQLAVEADNNEALSLLPPVTGPARKKYQRRRSNKTRSAGSSSSRRTSKNRH